MLISIPSSTARLFIAVVFIAFFALTTPAYSGQTQVSCARSVDGACIQVTPGQEPACPPRTSEPGVEQ